MAVRTVVAILKWLAPDEGGRAVPPTGPTIATVSEFEGQEGLPAGAWSLVVTFLERPDASRSHRVEVSFLAGEDAPQHWLTNGRSFKLFEGPRVVAKGTVTSDNDSRA